MKLNKNEILEEFSRLIIGALTLVAALAWNDAFRNFFQQYPSLQKNGPWIYAILVTCIAIIMMSIVTHYKEKCSDSKKK